MLWERDGLLGEKKLELKLSGLGAIHNKWGSIRIMFLMMTGVKWLGVQRGLVLHTTNELLLSPTHKHSHCAGQAQTETPGRQSLNHKPGHSITATKSISVGLTLSAVQTHVLSWLQTPRFPNVLRITCNHCFPLDLPCG